MANLNALSVRNESPGPVCHFLREGLAIILRKFEIIYILLNIAKTFGQFR